MTGDSREARFRDLMSAFPTGVAIVTGMHLDGTPRGMTCSSVVSVTMLPPTLLVCLGVGGATLEAVASRGRFGVNLLHNGGQRAAELFSGPGPDRFQQVSWRISKNGIPWLVKDAFAVAECRVSRLLTVGDRTVVFGEVCTIEQVAGTPLLYGRRRYASWPLPESELTAVFTKGRDIHAHARAEDRPAVRPELRSR